MKQIVTGLLAHVDAGKTTLSEALLFRGGTHRELGRVDHGNAFLDPNTIEKQRGITVFAHQATVEYPNLKLTLLDTPGHVDFAAQTEQVLPVLDYAILVISATEGLQGSTRTLWRLLHKYQVPTFIFINKMDVVGADYQAVLHQLQTEFTPGCLPFSDQLSQSTIEEIAATDDKVLEHYFASGTVSDPEIQVLIRARRIFPVYTGSALKLDGVDSLINGFRKWTVALTKSATGFAARVFKISHDDQGERLTWLRILRGSLDAKTELLPGEKVNQIRLYNGAKFTVVQSIPTGSVCAVTGLTSTYPGKGLGKLADQPLNEIQPVLTYAVDLHGNEPHRYLRAFRELEDEDPHLNVQWSEHRQEIHVHIMGEVQLEILQELFKQRYGMTISFTDGQINYRETITDHVEGVGHFEPLRHYAEVHLLLEPGERGSGITFANKCSVDVLKHNWQEQVMTSLRAKEHRGVLIGAPLTDVKITLINGRGSIKHSVGGDFREATWRAVRQGLMELNQHHHCQLLEPWYHFRLTVNQANVGRAINDLQQMAGSFKITDDHSSSLTLIIGSAPVSSMRNYQQAVRAYTHGEGSLELSFAGYRPCHNPEEIIAQADYHPTADLENTPDSVFCAHGAGYPVKWNEVPAKAHVEYQIK